VTQPELDEGGEAVEGVVVDGAEDVVAEVERLQGPWPDERVGVERGRFRLASRYFVLGLRKIGTMSSSPSEQSDLSRVSSHLHWPGHKPDPSLIMMEQRQKKLVKVIRNIFAIFFGLSRQKLNERSVSKKKLLSVIRRLRFFQPKWCINLFGFFSCFLVVLSPFREKNWRRRIFTFQLFSFFHRPVVVFSISCFTDFVFLLFLVSLRKLELFCSHHLSPAFSLSSTETEVSFSTKIRVMLCLLPRGVDHLIQRPGLALPLSGFRQKKWREFHKQRKMMVAISTNKIFCQITKIAFSLSCIFENVFFVRLFHIFCCFVRLPLKTSRLSRVGSILQNFAVCRDTLSNMFGAVLFSFTRTVNLLAF